MAKMLLHVLRRLRDRSSFVDAWWRCAKTARDGTCPLGFLLSGLIEAFDMS
jgi:hypothetical protein